MSTTETHMCPNIYWMKKTATINETFYCQYTCSEDILTNQKCFTPRVFLRFPPVLQYVVITFGLLPGVVFLWFLTNFSGSQWTLKMGRIYSPETLVTNQRETTLGKNPEVTTTSFTPNWYKLKLTVNITTSLVKVKELPVYETVL